MSERIDPTDVRQCHKVILSLPEGLPVMPGAYFRDDARMRPKSVEIAWDNRWSSRLGLSVYVHGVAIRKDGTEGVQRQGILIALPGAGRWRKDLPLEDAPEWLQDLVRRYTPPRPEFTTGGEPR